MTRKGTINIEFNLRKSHLYIATVLQKVSKINLRAEWTHSCNCIYTRWMLIDLNKAKTYFTQIEAHPTFV